MSEEQDELARRALAIAAALGAADPGDRAAARRMDGQGAPVFWRQVARLGLPRREEEGWLRFTRLVAILTPAGAQSSIHEAGRPLGAVLADGGDARKRLGTEASPFVSEQRLARLLAARGATRADALERTIRMIARSRPRLDVVSLARAVHGQDSGLARAYYTRIDQTPTEETQDA